MNERALRNIVIGLGGVPKSEVDWPDMPAVERIDVDEDGKISGLF